VVEEKGLTTSGPAADPMDGKRANYREYLANVAAGTLEATNKPLQLYLEVSSRCNLRCQKCGFSYDPALAKNGKDLSWPILSRMGEFFAAATEVYTFGYGEMFLYPELAPLITVLKGHGCRTSGVTNGLLIRPADVVWLVATGYDHLAFSIDGGTEETMEKLRGASLAKILRTLQLLHDEKERRKSVFPRIVVNFVAQSDNYAELPELARLLAPLGIYFLGVNPLHHFSGTGSAYHDYYAAYRLGQVERAAFEAAVAEARGIAEAAGTIFQNFVNPDFEWPPEAPADANPVALHNFKLPEAEAAAAAEPSPPAAEAAPAPATATGLAPMYCHYPWTTLYLSAGGKTRVCCYMSLSEDLGDFAGPDGIGSAWNGPALQSVREHIREGRVHPACSECVVHRSYQVHEAAMYPVREALGLPAVPAAPEPQPEPAQGPLRKLLKRFRKPPTPPDGASDRRL